MAALILSVGCYAQDMIVKKDGSIIQAKVSEIGTSEVKYKKWSNPDGPSYAIAKSDILAITYQNGEKETFEDATESEVKPNSSQGPKLVSRKASENNAALIAKCSKTHTTSIKAKDKNAPEGYGIFAFDENCVISNEDIEMTLVPSTATSPEHGGLFSSGTLYGQSYVRGRYCIQIRNNTNKTVYIDMSNCFRINEKANESICYYNAETVTTASGGASGTAFNLGGVTNAAGIGGALGSIANATTTTSGKSASVQRTFTQQQILTIPPKGIRKLNDFTLVEAKKGGTFTYGEIACAEKGEEFIYGNRIQGKYNSFAIEYRPSHIKKGEVKLGETKRYSLEESPIVYNYTFTYSTDPSFAEYSTLTPTLYLKELHGHGATTGIYLTKDASQPIEDLPDMDAYTIFGNIIFEIQK